MREEMPPPNGVRKKCGASVRSEGRAGLRYESVAVTRVSMLRVATRKPRTLEELSAAPP